MKEMYATVEEIRAEGKLEGKVEVLMDEGFSVEQIAQKLDIPEDKVEEIINNLE